MLAISLSSPTVKDVSQTRSSPQSEASSSSTSKTPLRVHVVTIGNPVTQLATNFFNNPGIQLTARAPSSSSSSVAPTVLHTPWPQVTEFARIDCKKPLFPTSQEKLSHYVDSLFSDISNRDEPLFINLKKEVNKRLETAILAFRKKKFDSLIESHSQEIRDNLKLAERLDLMDRETQSCCLRRSARSKYHQTLAIPRNQIILTIKRRLANEINILLLNLSCEQVIERYHAQEIEPLKKNIQKFRNKLKVTATLQQPISRFNWAIEGFHAQKLKRLKHLQDFQQKQLDIFISLQDLISRFERAIKGFHAQKFEKLHEDMQDFLKKQMGISIALQDLISRFELAIEGFHAQKFEQPQQDIGIFLKTLPDISISLQDLITRFERAIEGLHVQKFEQLHKDMQDFLGEELDISVPLKDSIEFVNKIAFDLIDMEVRGSQFFPHYQNKGFTIEHEKVAHKVGRNFCQAAITHNGFAAKDMLSKFTNDFELMDLALNTSSVFRVASKRIQHMPQFRRKAVARDPDVLADLKAWGDSPALVSAAIAKQGSVIAFTSSRYRDDFNTGYVAVNNDETGSALKSLSKRLRGNDIIFKLAIRININAWEHGSLEVQTDPTNVKLMFELIKGKHNGNPGIKSEFVDNLQKVMGKTEESNLHKNLMVQYGALEDRFRNPHNYMQFLPKEVLFRTNHPNKVQIVKVVVAYCPELFPKLSDDLRNHPEIIKMTSYGPSGLDEQPSEAAIHFEKEAIAKTTHPKGKIPAVTIHSDKTARSYITTPLVTLHFEEETQIAPFEVTDAMRIIEHKEYKEVKRPFEV